MQAACWQRDKLSWLALLLGLQLSGIALSPGDFTSLFLMGLPRLEPVTNPAVATAGEQGGPREEVAATSRENPLCHNLTPPRLS